MKTSLKSVKVIALYAHKTNGKLNGVVTYAVRSSDGSTLYCTTLINGNASGCGCPSKKPCYHMTQLVAIEAARNPIVRKSDESSTVMVDSKSAKATDVSKLGHLNTARAFSIM